MTHTPESSSRHPPVTPAEPLGAESTTGVPRDTRDFYDVIAPYYHLIYGRSWEEHLNVQAGKIEAVLRDHLGSAGPWAILDSACGIGTQALGLAQRGHAVTGVDLSAEAVNRAGVEAKTRNLPVEVIHGDMLMLSALTRGRSFDAVLSCDNVLRHLPGREGIELACAELAACLKPGGILIATLRDFTPEKQQIAAQGTGTSFKTYSSRLTADGEVQAFFQIGRFTDGFYEFSFMAAESSGSRVTGESCRLRLLDISAAEVREIMLRSGFSEVTILPGVAEFYGHDLLVARRSGGSDGRVQPGDPRVGG